MSNRRSRILPALALTGLLLAGLAVDFTGAQGIRQRRQAAGTAVVDTGAKAPLGTYSATTGSSASTGGAQGGGVARRRSATTGATAGGTVTINLTAYSTSTEFQQVAGAGQGGTAEVIKGFASKGTVTIGGQSFTINMATSATAGSNYVIYLLSATPFGGTGPRGTAATGGAVGVVELTIPAAGGAGTGKMYSSTQVAVTPEGGVTIHGGASTATALSGVTKIN